MKALATAQIEAQQIKDEAHEDSKATGAQDFDLQIENMSKVGRLFNPDLQDSLYLLQMLVAMPEAIQHIADRCFVLHK